MSRTNVFLFSGQGSQYYQMGKELFLTNQTFRKWMFKQNEIMYDLTGESLLNHLYDQKRMKSELFDNLTFSHPAIFMVEVALAQALIEGGRTPDYVAGTSLGEFASAVVAGVLEVDEVIRILTTQARMVTAHCPPGGMITIIDNPALFEQEPILHENSELASVNYHQSFVISGTDEGLAVIQRYLDQQEKLYQRLPVRFAFHASYLDVVKPFYLDTLQGLTLRKPQIPFVSSVTGGILDELPQDYFWEIARQPIRFPQAVQTLESIGSHDYIDMGPSGTMKNFVHHNLPQGSTSECHTIMSPYSQDAANLEKLLGQNV
ncbi:acyltransferase domain-containing protein [Brevibacillus dissolubilis]|uniref:acyltransferase domain-containing protein n=1 Tax=Brevibacillus dissolubilis TaxID=1844116 RepID=UPI00111617AE|nr:acyltransferase domain-containing protein [Brevibacillus dissolubilis]